jgi:hypothetical protein
MMSIFKFSQMGEEGTLMVVFFGEEEVYPTVYGIIEEKLPCLSYFPT